MECSRGTIHAPVLHDSMTWRSMVDDIRRPRHSSHIWREAGLLTGSDMLQAPNTITQPCRQSMHVAWHHAPAAHLVIGPSGDFGLDSDLAFMSSAMCLLTSFSSAASTVLASGFIGASRLCLSRRTSALTATTLETELLLASLLLAKDRSGVRPNEADLPACNRALGLMRLSTSHDKLLRRADVPLSLTVLRPSLTASLPGAPAFACSCADEELPVPSAERTTGSR